MTDDIRQVFDYYATEYDTWFDTHAQEYQAELNQVRQAIGEVFLPSLEIGVGSGRFASPLAIQYGIEPSRRLARMAQERGIGTIQGRGEYLPFKEDIFRFISMITVFCFLDYPMQTCKEIHRTLSDDGLLFIAFIERGGEIFQRYRTRSEKSRFLSLARFSSREEVIAILSQSGFSLISSGCINGFCTLSFRKDKM